MNKAEMKRELFAIAAEAVERYPHMPISVLGDRVSEARWKDAQDEVTARLRSLSRPRRGTAR